MQQRPYQVKAYEEIRALIRQGIKRILLVCPTGGGKTVLAAHILSMGVAKGSEGLFLARSKELIVQCSNKLRGYGVDHGIIKAGYPIQMGKPVQVGSTMTVYNRYKNANPHMKMWQPAPDIIIPDETHELSPTLRHILDLHPDSIIIGLTGSPARTDGKGLGVTVGGVYEAMVLCSSYKELISLGYLVKFRVFESPLNLDFSGVAVVAGEFDKEQASAFMDKADLIGDVYLNWTIHAYQKRTIVFSQSTGHGKHLLKVFSDNGIKAIYLDAKSGEEERDKGVDDFRAGRVTVMINYGLFTQGLDVPEVECIVEARMTLSLILAKQMPGRGSRPIYAPGLPQETAEERLAAIAASVKPYCILLDHGGNTRRHGMPDDDVAWSLEGRKKKNRPVIPSLQTCPKCFAMWRSSVRVCESCGEILKIFAGRAELPQVASAILVEHNPLDVPVLTKKAAAALALEEERKYLAEMVVKGAQGRFKFKYPLVRFKDKYGHWPRKKHGVQIEWVSTGEEIPGTEGRFKMAIAWWELDGVRYEDAAADSVMEAA